MMQSQFPQQSLISNYLRDYKTLKRELARTFGLTDAKVQSVNDELIALYKNNKQTLTPVELVTFAKDQSTACNALFNWDEDQFKCLMRAEDILKKIPFLIGSDKMIYILQHS